MLLNSGAPLAGSLPRPSQPVKLLVMCARLGSQRPKSEPSGRENHMGGTGFGCEQGDISHV